MAAIEVDHVWKSFRYYHQRALTIKEIMTTRRSQYDLFWALQDVSFDVGEGQMLGIIGPNGSGKSTMLKTLARILVPNRGSVTVEGKVSSLLELGTGFHMELSGRENLYLGGSILRMSKADIDARLDEIVGFAGLERFIDMPVKNYSSGMYARLAFALAINVDADVLLVDEVLSVGDEEFQTRSFERIRNLRSSGATIVFVSHSLAAVRSLCDMALWLQQGETRMTGEASAVVTAYHDEVHAGRADADSIEPDAPMEHHGEGGIRISGVRLVAPSGSEYDPDELVPGVPLTVRIEYEAERRFEELCATIYVGSPIDSELSGVSSGDDVEPFSVVPGGGYIDFYIPSLPFVPERYKVGVGLHDRGKRHVYDWVEDARFLSVAVGTREILGRFTLTGDWSQGAGPAPPHRPGAREDVEVQR